MRRDRILHTDQDLDKVGRGARYESWRPAGESERGRTERKVACLALRKTAH